MLRRKGYDLSSGEIVHPIPWGEGGLMGQRPDTNYTPVVECLASKTIARKRTSPMTLQYLINCYDMPPKPTHLRSK